MSGSQVEFVGKQGKDTSGLTRELFMIFGRFSSRYLTPSGCFYTLSGVARIFEKGAQI